VIRRLLLACVLALGLMTAGATAASAAEGNIACVYNLQPLNLGFCLGL
jgi:hypothetical protein